MKRVIALLAAGIVILSAGSYACAEGHDFKQKRQQIKQELRERLNLTPEQQEQAKQIRENAKPEIAPVIEQIKQKKQEIKEMKQTDASSEELKEKREEIKSLRQKANAIRKENMQKFESILNPEQKTEFNRFKEEMKQKRKNYKGKRKHQNFNED